MHSKLNADTLILIITSRCNLDCDYCQVLKENKDMNFEAAWRAVSLFLGERNTSSQRQIKFFGGEPLLNSKLIKDIVEKVNKNHKDVGFRLATNGVLLDSEMLEFIKDNSNVELLISSKNIGFLEKKGLIKKVAELPAVAISLNLFPGGLEKIENQVEELLKTGFLKFNFLPAYFIHWPPEDIKLLRIIFGKVAKIIQQSSRKVEIINLGISSAVPLFNLTPTVDQEGDVYAGNFILDKRFKNWKTELKVGNIQSVGAWSGIRDLSFDYDFLIKKIFPSDILISTEAVDKELSRFVNFFKD